jgi:hypothetical protein
VVEAAGGRAAVEAAAGPVAAEAVGEVGEPVEVVAVAGRVVVAAEP